jgi:hypothetical protein
MNPTDAASFAADFYSPESWEASMSEQPEWIVTDSDWDSLLKAVDERLSAETRLRVERDQSAKGTKL